MAVAGYDKGIKDVITLQKALGIQEYSEFVQKIKELEEQGKLKATKNGKETNGKYPPLSKKYRIIEETQDFSELIQEIKIQFPLKYKKSYYISHLEKYTADQLLIKNLWEYDQRVDKPLLEPMSLNERFFDIFKHEKNISSSRIKGILGNLGLNNSYLNYYETPEPFIYYSASEKLEQHILIIENKDTWYTLRKLKQDGIGIFDSLIYGEGKKILKSFGEIGVHQKIYFNNPDNHYYYFGDLDDEGLLIYIRLKEKANLKGIDIKLWKQGYDKMYQLAESEDRWRVYKDQKSLSKEEILDVLSFMNKEEVNNITRRFDLNEYIPQEITNYKVLKNILKEDC